MSEMLRPGISTLFSSAVVNGLLSQPVHRHVARLRREGHERVLADFDLRQTVADMLASAAHRIVAARIRNRKLCRSRLENLAITSLSFIAPAVIVSMLSGSGVSTGSR